MGNIQQDLKRAMGGGGRSMMRVRAIFFDDKKVLRAFKKAGKRSLSASGGAIRKWAQRSMRYVKEERVGSGKLRPGSKPGQPPRAVKPHPWLRRHLYYGYDPDARSVVVGPMIFGPASGAPAILEYGGSSAIKNRRRIKRRVGGSGEARIGASGGASTKLAKDTLLGNINVTYMKIFSADQARRANDLNEQLYGAWESQSVSIAKRPYMAPALAAEVPHMAERYQDSLIKTV